MCGNHAPLLQNSWTLTRQDYAANGGLGSLTDYETGRRYVYSYDGLDRLISMTETCGTDAVQVFHAAYDDANRVSATEYRVSPTWDGELGQTRSYGYTYSSTNGSLSGMTLPGGGAYSYQYDGLRRLDTRTLTRNNSAFLTRSYGYVAGSGANDTTMLVGSLTNSTGSGSPLNGWNYTYDAAGHITSISDGTEIWSYTYDAQGQLLTETLGTGDDAQTWSYTYDTAGNLRSVTTPGITLQPIDPGIPFPPQPTVLPMGDGEGEGEGEGDDDLDLSPLTISHTYTYTYGNAQWPDLLTAYNGEPIDYDAIGNPLAYRGWSFTWQGGRQLASASNGGLDLSFVYNESGVRTEKTVNGGEVHRYVYRGSTLVAEITGNYALYFHHDANGGIVGFTYVSGNTEAEYFYRKNLQGDIIGIVDSSGASVAEYRYDAWGQILEATGSMADLNPIRYRGYYYDNETGLYYVSNRYYDPEICRWINADDSSNLGANSDFASVNLFAYCGNCPVSRSDNSGEFWHIVVGAIIGAVVNVATSYITNTLAGKEYTWEDALVDAAAGAITGGLAASGAGPLAQGIVNGVVSASTTAYSTYKETGKIKWGAVAVSGVFAFASSYAPGFTANKQVSNQVEIINSNLHCFTRPSAARTIQTCYNRISDKATTAFFNYVDVNYAGRVVTYLASIASK